MIADATMNQLLVRRFWTKMNMQMKKRGMWMPYSSVSTYVLSDGVDSRIELARNTYNCSCVDCPNQSHIHQKLLFIVCASSELKVVEHCASLKPDVRWAWRGGRRAGGLGVLWLDVGTFLSKLTTCTIILGSRALLVKHWSIALNSEHRVGDCTTEGLHLQRQRRGQSFTQTVQSTEIVNGTDLRDDSPGTSDHIRHRIGPAKIGIYYNKLTSYEIQNNEEYGQL